jgi:hypothetical protein
MSKCIDLTGQRFGRLTVVKRVGKVGMRNIKWLCLCDCGNFKVIRRGCLKAGTTKSCGCLHKEIVIKQNTTHGDTGKRLHNIWKAMRLRCNWTGDTGYANYGGRGIKVCDEWDNNYLKFKQWALSHGYTDNLTIERKNVNGNYTPDNCMWISPSQQSNNRRNVLHIEYKGTTKKLIEWSEILGISSNVLYERMHCYKWSVKRAFETPVRIYPPITYQNKTQSISAWARELGICERVLIKRINEEKWPIEKAMITPIKKRNKKE